VRKLIVNKAYRYHANMENKRGVEVGDLIQQGDFAVLEAVRYYKPDGEYKFTTYLNQTLKNAFRAAVGIRTSKRDMLDYAASLDEPLGEDGGLSLLDVIADTTADNTPDDRIESIYNQQLHKALDNALQILPDGQRDAVALHYYFGLPFERIAEAKGATKQAIGKQAIGEREYRALERIRNSGHRRIMIRFSVLVEGRGKRVDGGLYRAGGMGQ
jgi:RNA polymerase sporulation-specific sigma factor